MAVVQLLCMTGAYETIHSVRVAANNDTYRQRMPVNEVSKWAPGASHCWLRCNQMALQVQHTLNNNYNHDSNYNDSDYNDDDDELYEYDDDDIDDDAGDNVHLSSVWNTNCLQVPRTDWVLKWPGQLVIAGCQTFWTTEVSEALEKGDLEGYVPTLLSQVP